MHGIFVGGGIGGLSAAIALDRGGIRTDVFERVASRPTGGDGGNRSRNGQVSGEGAEELLRPADLVETGGET